METIIANSAQILLGKQGENDARKIQFDISRLVGLFGAGTVQLLHRRPGDETPYPVPITRAGAMVTWTVSSADTASAGTGQAELQYFVGNTLAKSETYYTIITASLGGAGSTPPEPQAGWVSQVLQAGIDATEAAARAENAALHPPIIGDNGNWWLWDFDLGDYVDSGLPSAGEGTGANAPVQSVNGKIGDVILSAADVGARPDTWTPTSEEVGARPITWTPTAAETGADPSGTAAETVAAHNVDPEAHNDIRLAIEGLATRLNALANSDDTTLDQMAEVVEYIKANRTLIESITTSKVSVSDIIDNLTTNVSDQPLSAAQGVALKKLIDALSSGKLDATAIADWAKASTKPAYTKSEVGLGNVENVKQYSASNPPPYPVTSVNEKTGAVSLGAADVGAVATSDIVQGTGDSTTAVMSQAAVTEEFTKLSNEKADNPLYGKKISLIGDSICAGSSESTSYLGGYGKIIADRNNMAYENLAKAGSTITAETYSSTTGAAKGWICRMVEGMSADADYAIVEGGYNDAWQYVDHGNIEIGEISDGYNAVLDDTTYYGAFESMLKQLVTKFQGKKIGYIAVPKMMDKFDSNRNAPNFYHIALECCAKWGVPVCDLNTIIPPFEYLETLGTVYTADGSHPTYEGYLKYYCDPIEAWMKTLTTGANVGQAAPVATDNFILKSDVQIKKAQLTLEDGSTVLIDVVVASAGTTIKTYLNLIPTSIDTDGSIYNGVGYKGGTRLSSSGVEKENGYSYVFGYIPAKGGDVVRIFNCGWGTDLNANNYICAYDSSFTFIGARCTNTTSGKTLTTYSTEILDSFDWDDAGNTTLTLSALSNIAYIRVNSRGSTNENAYTYDPTDAIITVNQEIT